MESLVALLPMGVFLAFAGAMAWYSKAQHEALERAWAEIARARQWEMQSGRYFPFRSGVIRGTADNVVFEIDHYDVSQGRSSTPYTRVRAKAIEPMPLVTKVYREGLLSTVGKLIGTQDVEVGQPEFDEKFMVKADDVAAARALFDSELCRDLLGFPPESVTFEYRAGEVSLTWIAKERSHAVLDRAVRVIASACRWRRPAQSLR